MVPTAAEILEEEREQGPARTQLEMLQLLGTDHTAISAWEDTAPQSWDGAACAGWRAEHGGQSVGRRAGRELGQPGPLPAPAMHGKPPGSCLTIRNWGFNEQFQECSQLCCLWH